MESFSLVQFKSMVTKCIFTRKTALLTNCLHKQGWEQRKRCLDIMVSVHYFLRKRSKLIAEKHPLVTLSLDSGWADATLLTTPPFVMFFSFFLSFASQVINPHFLRICSRISSRHSLQEFLYILVFSDNSYIRSLKSTWPSRFRRPTRHHLLS